MDKASHPHLERGVRFLLKHDAAVQATIDGAAWAAAITFATVVRWNFALSRLDWGGLAAVIPLASLAQLVAGLVAGLYTGKWRFGSFDEIAALARAAAITTGVVTFADLVVVVPHMVPISATVAGGVVALALQGGVRYLWRLNLERRRRPTAEGSARLLVFGAGEGGLQMVTALLRDPASPYYPVALLDDNPRKRNLTIMGVPVLGGRQAIGPVAGKTGAEVLLIAIPSASGELVSELTDLAEQAGLAVKVLPPVAELFDDTVGIGDIRDLSMADLLGRHEIRTDIDAIAGYLTGRRVLVTGAGGSIGSELCRQIYRFAPSELIMVDRDESALHAVQLSIEGRALLESSQLVLLDIREAERVRALFAERRPEVVFHAAALKHLTLLERFPGEAVKTNLWATLTLLEASRASGVQRFVNISTDKAADPTSVLGYSKRLTERLTAHYGGLSEGAYLSVRFGNVLGSRGSMLDTFVAQVERGGPITVTDPEVTRFFMTIEEAVQLVIQAGAIGSSGQALVLDMGEPVRIADVARRLATSARRHVEIVFTGLRPGEKLHEVLLGSGELDHRPAHPLISHVAVPPLEPEMAWRRLDASMPARHLVEAMRSLCVRESSAAEDAI